MRTFDLWTCSVALVVTRYNKGFALTISHFSPFWEKSRLEIQKPKKLLLSKIVIECYLGYEMIPSEPKLFNFTKIFWFCLFSMILSTYLQNNIKSLCFKNTKFDGFSFSKINLEKLSNFFKNLLRQIFLYTKKVHWKIFLSVLNKCLWL